MEKNVLIVEDERAIVEILKFNLKREGYETMEALDGETGLRLALEGDPDLILLDVMLPKMNGFDICAEIRRAGKVTPVIMLMARVKANIRRRDLDYGVRPKGELLRAGALTVDPAAFTVTKDASPVELTQKEFDLLLYLIRERGRVFTREDLMQKVWNYDYFGDMRTVDVTVRRLREKIENDPGKPELILTKRGVGYYFAP